MDSNSWAHPCLTSKYIESLIIKARISTMYSKKGNDFQHTIPAMRMRLEWHVIGKPELLGGSPNNMKDLLGICKIEYEVGV